MTPEQERELADAIVACGVGEKREFPGRYQLNGATLWQERFIRDWRVAGALMEKCSHIDAYWDDTGWSCDVVGTFKDRQLGSHDGMVARSSLVIAINQACVAALRGKDDG